MQLLPPDFTISTRRLLLRIPNESDIPHVFSASRFPGFNDGMLWDPPETIEELYGPLERSLSQWAEGVGYHFSIDVDGMFVGRVALRSTETVGVLDTGYWTHPDHQGKGYMSEAVAAIVHLGFETMGAEAMVAECADWNTSSRRILEKLDFQIVRVIPKGFVKGDRAWDEIWYRLESSAFRDSLRAQRNQ